MSADASTTSPASCSVSCPTNDLDSLMDVLEASYPSHFSLFPDPTSSSAVPPDTSPQQGAEEWVSENGIHAFRPAVIKQKKERKRRRKEKSKQRNCLHCGLADPKHWRNGPSGKGTLCNVRRLLCGCVCTRLSNRKAGLRLAVCQVSKARNVFIVGQAEARVASQHY